MNKYGVWKIGDKGINKPFPEVVFHGQLFNCPSDRFEVNTLLAWKNSGIDCLRQLDGNFCALILTDEELVAFSDPVGATPLYYSIQGSQVHWSTDLTRLINKLPNVSISNNFLYSFLVNDLTLRHPYNLNETVYKNIYRLPPGYFLRINKENLLVENGWNWDTDEYQELSYEETLLTFKRLFIKSCEKRLSTFADCGLLLSSGLDSTSVIFGLLESVESTERIIPISYTFPGDSESDEGNKISVFLKNIGIKGHFIRLDNLNLFNDLFESYPEIGQPTNITNIYGLLKSAEILNNLGVKVLFTGHGGDALMASNHRSPIAMIRQRKFIQFRQWWNSIKHFKERPNGYIVQNIILPSLFRNEQYIHMDHMENLKLPSWITPENEIQKNMLISNGNVWGGSLFDADNNSTYGMDWLMGKQEIQSTHPFFDRDLIRFLVNIPPWFKEWPIYNHKRILKDFLQDKLPDEYIYRRKTTHNWVMNSFVKARSLFDDRFKNSNIYNLNFILKDEFLSDYQNLLQGLTENRRHIGTFFRAVVLEKWLEMNKEKI